MNDRKRQGSTDYNEIAVKKIKTEPADKKDCKRSIRSFKTKTPGLSYEQAIKAAGHSVETIEEIVALIAPDELSFPDFSSRDPSQTTSLNFNYDMTFIDVQELEGLKQKGIKLERANEEIKRLNDNSERMNQFVRLLSAKDEEITKQRKEIQKLTANYEKAKEENQVLRQKLGR
jgi:hypothetical protein